MNKTKVIMREIGRHLVTVETLMERRQFVLPCIIFRFTLPRSGLMIEQRQFPLQLCYAIIVNKSQSQTLDRVCLDLREYPFAHGQLYVRASSVGNCSNILIQTLDNHLHHSCALTKNIISTEILGSKLTIIVKKLMSSISATIFTESGKKNKNKHTPDIKWIPFLVL